MIILVGIAIILLNLVIFYIGYKINRLWRRLPHDNISRILLWMSVGIILISLGGIVDGAVYVLSPGSWAFAVGGTLMLLGMIIFTVGSLKSRHVIFDIIGTKG